MVKEFSILQTFIHINIDMCPTLNYYILILFRQSCSDKHCALCHFFAPFTISLVVATTCRSFNFYQIILMYIYLLVSSDICVKTFLVFPEGVRGRGSVIIEFSGVVWGFGSEVYFWFFYYTNQILGLLINLKIK